MPEKAGNPPRINATAEEIARATLRARPSKIVGRICRCGECREVVEWPLVLGMMGCVRTATMGRLRNLELHPFNAVCNAKQRRANVKQWEQELGDQKDAKARHRAEYESHIEGNVIITNEETQAISRKLIAAENDVKVLQSKLDVYGPPWYKWFWRHIRYSWDECIEEKWGCYGENVGTRDSINYWIGSGRGDIALDSERITTRWRNRTRKLFLCLEFGFLLAAILTAELLRDQDAVVEELPVAVVVSSVVLVTLAAMCDAIKTKNKRWVARQNDGPRLDG